MKNSLLILIVLIFFSYKEEKVIINVKVENKIETNENLLEPNQKESIDNSIELEKIGEDCIFDQSTQTDDFLKGIKELEGYVWFEEDKIAELVLNDHWSLSIKRGGCDHFELSAAFFYERILDFEENKKDILDKIVWVTSLLNEEFESNEIKKSIEENKMTFTEVKNGFYGNFLNSKIYEMYTFYFTNGEQNTNFGISFYQD